MKDTCLLAFLLLFACPFLAKSSLSIPATFQDYAIDSIKTVAAYLKSASQRPAIDIGNITVILLGMGSGYLAGALEVRGDYNSKLCYENVNVVIQVYQEVLKIIQGGMEKEFWKMIRQFLVIGVKILNVTIDEIRYCKGFLSVFWNMYYTFNCFLICKDQYFNYFANHVIYRSYDYLYYFKECWREFNNGNYQMSGKWLAFGINTLFIIANQCSTVAVNCGIPIENY